MFSFLKNHPFGVEAFFKSSIVLTFAVPKEELQSFIPECVELDVYKDKWAFIAVALVQTEDLRPKGFPKFLGNDFFLIGYRIFVRYNNNGGKKLRGLYILKSETNKKSMEFLGNIFTQYKYTTTDISLSEANGIIRIKSIKSNFNIAVDAVNTDVQLPPDSPFENWQQARRFAGPLPFTFTYNREKKSVLIVEGVRKLWEPNAIAVVDYDFSFLKALDLKEVILANAFMVNKVEYYWKQGKLEQWNL